MTASTATTAPAGTHVHHMRQVLLWPLRLMPASGADHTHQRPWEVLRALGEAGASPWREVVDEFNGDAANFHERHYNEFVTFLPYVQRFLYGEARSGRAETGGAGMRVFRRHDVAQVRVTAQADAVPLTLSIVHTDLYFFFDVDVVMLNVEVSADDLALAEAQDLLYRFGRGYPAGWDGEGKALHCMHSVEWLDAQGQVLSRSDAQQRDAFLAHVCEKRAPRIAAHWQFMLEPLVYDMGDQAGALRYRQIEYYRMPVMAYLSLQDPRALSREDFIRLGLVTGQGRGALPYSEQHLNDFEQQVCYDRFWGGSGAAPDTRYLCSGLSLIVVGSASSEFFTCRDRGVLAQFRHQHFLLFLIAHLQKSSLLMFSDRLAEALNCLNVVDANSVRRFKRRIRSSFEGFLRFTHRYWFKDISEQTLVRALYQMCSTQLGLERLHAEVKVRVEDMNGYLEADSLRRQANTVVRLTVVTIFGLIGTVTTGFLGMNLLAEAEAPMSRRLWVFGIVFAVTTVLTAYTMIKSKRLSDFLDVLSDERLPLWTKMKALAGVWRAEQS